MFFNKEPYYLEDHPASPLRLKIAVNLPEKKINKISSLVTKRRQYKTSLSNFCRKKNIEDIEGTTKRK
jgi:hypothetical protein